MSPWDQDQPAQKLQPDRLHRGRTCVAILRDKFEWSAERVNNVRAEIATFTKHVAPTETLDVVKDDTSDNRIVECAVAAESDVIVSGDKHLIALGSFRGIKVMTVSDFLQRGPGRDR
jgi:uncharacterized protein